MDLLFLPHSPFDNLTFTLPSEQQPLCSQLSSLWGSCEACHIWPTRVENVPGPKPIDTSYSLVIDSEMDTWASYRLLAENFGKRFDDKEEAILLPHCTRIRRQNSTIKVLTMPCMSWWTASRVRLFVDFPVYRHHFCLSEGRLDFYHL